MPKNLYDPLWHELCDFDFQDRFGGLCEPAPI